MKSVFDGIRVLDIGQLIAGPIAASVLADFGADVIRVERPISGDPLRWLYPKDGVGLMYKVQARNKRSVTLNLKSDEGREMFHQLVAQADVVVENFRPGVMERLGCGWDVLSKINPRLIMCRMSGWGQEGPYKDQRSYGRIGEAFGGFAFITGEQNGSVMHSTMSLGDSTAGVWAAMGIMMALYWRDAQGGNVGQVVDMALYEGLFRQIEQLIVVPAHLGAPITRNGNFHKAVPFIGTYKTKDGNYFTFGGLTPKSTDDILRALELYGDPRFADYESSLANKDAFIETVTQWMAERTAAEVHDAFLKYQAPGTPAMSGADLLADPQVKHREMIISVPDDQLGEVTMQGVVPKLTASPGKVKHAGQALGASNEEVYGQLLGYSKEKMADLKEKGVI